MKTRKLLNWTETYNDLIEGSCSCGNLITKVTGSNFLMFNDGIRYHYSKDKTKYAIFRCKKCYGVISETFKPNN